MVPDTDIIVIPPGAGVSACPPIIVIPPGAGVGDAGPRNLWMHLHTKVRGHQGSNKAPEYHPHSALHSTAAAFCDITQTTECHGMTRPPSEGTMVRVGMALY